MTMTQDPTHPTGVVSDSPRGDSGTVKARGRKAAAALEMRRRNCEWDEIAEVLGYPDGATALMATEKALEAGILAPESQEFLRALAGSRLEELLGAVYPQALNTEHPDQLSFHDRARATIRDHADLLGYKAPQEFTVNNPSVARLEAWVAAVQAKDTVDIEEADIFETHEGDDGVFDVIENEDPK